MSAPKEQDYDPRFTLGLLLDVAKVLAKHGYPLDGKGLVGLQMALYDLLRSRNEKAPETKP